MCTRGLTKGKTIEINKLVLKVSSQGYISYSRGLPMPKKEPKKHIRIVDESSRNLTKIKTNKQ